MIVNAVWGMIFAVVLYVIHACSLPVTIGLCAAFVLASVLDIYIDQRKK